MDKADKVQTMKTPKGLGKKKEKSGVGVLWAREPWALEERGRHLPWGGAQVGAEGRRPLKAHLRPGDLTRPCPTPAPYPRGGRTFISFLTSSTGSGEER